ncbi:LuxR C-terminal-related transcriptional regulator [Streptomyces avidinii]|uniref:ATP-binding protein n=1 Tax=Streptomyces TaxID=1883 RepID=UPI002E2BF8A0|nr:LuxR C-terminal-related transcriptional regulator [Streptomyces sp. NBC_00273]WST43497.1 LuxR C-terminal-related transcriptional regulator [Streptomyces avidinii]WTA95612.1 LuxR C-terminal-related transcriptional regulator [Streptomyces avidinii]
MTGPAGIGKSRLAVQLAHTLQRSFPAGTWLIDVAALEAGEAITSAASAMFGLRPSPDGRPIGALTEYLRERRTLIVFDNCEHLLHAVAVLTSALLEAAPHLRVIVTSRQTLGVDGEQLLMVPSLPPPGPVLPSTRPAVRNDAVRLFTDRAISVLGAFDPSPADVQAAAEICHRLEGVPLAIELAAARLRVLACDQILDRLDDSFALLTGGSRAAPPRFRTLRAAVDWSYNLCSDQEQRLWARMSVFSAGFNLAAVEAVCTDESLPRSAVLDMVAGLVDKSVLIREEHDHQVFYRMLGTMRQYGQLRLQEHGLSRDLVRRHRDHYHALVRRAEAEWFTAKQPEWLVRLQREQPNIRDALQSCLNEPGEARRGMEIITAVRSHRLGIGHLQEDRACLAQLLALDTEPSPDRAKALWTDGWLALLTGDTAGGAVRAAECGGLARVMGDPGTHAAAGQLAGLSALFQDDFVRAIDLLEDARARYEALGDAGESWTTLHHLVLAACFAGDRRAAGLAQDLLDRCDTHDMQWARPHALWALALRHWLAQEPEQVVTMLRACLRDALPSHDRFLVARCLEMMAWARARQGHSREAAKHLGAAQSLWQQTSTLFPGVGQSAVHHLACERELRTALGDAAFEKHVRTGAASSVQQALALALLDDRVLAHPLQKALPPLLTAREQQVAGLLREGLSDKQIAARLVISPRTAQGHVQRILLKLGLTRRAQVVAWVHDQAPRS